MILKMLENQSPLSVNYNLITNAYRQSIKDVIASNHWNKSRSSQADIIWLNCESQSQEMLDYCALTTEAAVSKIPGMKEVCYKNLNGELMNIYA